MRSEIREIIHLQTLGGVFLALLFSAAGSFADSYQEERIINGNFQVDSRLYNMQRTLMQTAEPACKIDAFVTESTKVRNLANSLTFSLSLSCSLPAKSSIIISGIPAHSTPRSPIPARGTIAASMNPDTAVASAGANGVDLAVILSQDLGSGCDRTLHFTFPNPSKELEESESNVEISIVHADVAQQSSWGRYTVMSDASLMKPAQILRGELSNVFTTRLVSESSGVSGELNVLTFTVQPDFPLPVGTLVSIDGLAGSLTPTNYWFNNSAAVSSEQGCTAASAHADVEWELSAGLCRIRNPNGACINIQAPPSTFCSFHHLQVGGAGGSLFGGVGQWFNYGSLILNCSAFLAPDSNLTDCMPATSATEFSITLRNPTAARTGQSPRVAAASASVSIDAQGLQLLPREPYPFVLGGREANGFVSASVSEETDMVAVDNELTFSLAANVDIRAGSTLRIFGLTGTQTLGTTLEVKGPSRQLFTAQTALWDRTSGTVRLPVGSNIPARQTVEFAVTMTNQQYAINARRVFASMSGATPIPQHAVAGSVLGSGGEIKWRAAVVSESSDIQGAVNTLTLRFIPSVSLPNATAITLSGLGGVTLRSTSGSVPIGGVDAASFSAGTFDASAGTMVVVARRTLSQFCATQISIQVLNPVAERTAANLGLAATGVLPIPNAPLVCKELPCQVLRAAVNASWDTRAVAESSALAGSVNTISVSLSPSHDLPPGTLVSIAGFTGSPTTSRPFLPLAGSGATLFGSTAAWTQTSGTLVLTVGSEWAHGTTSVFSFDLTNPSAPKPAVTPTVSGVVDGSLACAIYLSCSRNYQSMVVGPQLMAGSLLSASDEPTVTTSLIAETSAVRGFINTLSVTLALNRQLNVGSSLTIAGLTGSQEYLQTWSLFGTDASKFNQTTARWSFATGKVTAKLIQTIAASQSIVFSFKLRNGNSAQTAVVPTVNFTDASGAMIAAATFDASVLGFSAAILLTGATVSESTNQIGNENEIVFMMTPNHPIPAGAIITISGLVSAFRAASGTVFAEGNAQALGGSEAARFTSSQGTWTSSSALKLTVASTISSDCASTFSLLNVYNPRAPAVASAIDVAVFGTALEFCGLGNATHPGVVASFWTNITTCVQVLEASCEKTFNFGQCAYPVTSAQRTATQAGLDSSGAILTANGTNSFVVALASESSALRGRANTITFTLRPTGVVRSGETISISGLANSQTATTANLLLGGTDRTSFTSNRGIFDANAGLLTVLTRVDIPSTRDTVFSITLTNPNCPCITVSTFPCPGNASLTCSSSAERAAIIPSIEVTEEPYKLAKKSMQNPVLAGNQNASWLRISVSEAHSIQDVATRVTFRLASSHTIPSGEVFTVSGLTGTQSDTTPLISSPRAWFSTPISWDQSTGTLDLAASSATPEGLSLDFSVCIVHRSTVQLSRSPSIRSSTVFDAPTSIPVTGSGSLLAATDRIRFLVAAVHESSRTLDAFNTISISLRPNIAFGPLATLTISGLGETSLGLVAQTISLDGPSASIFGGAASLSAAGVLSLQVATAQVLPGSETTTVIQFTYKNPSSESKRVGVSPTLTGQWKTAPNIQCSTSQSTVVFVATSMVLSVENHATPASLSAAAWTAASVLEGSKVPDTPNTLEFRLRPGHDVLQKTQVEINGMRGSTTAASECLALGGVHRSVFTGACGKWTTDGSLALTVADGVTMSHLSDTLFSITLQNPASSQAERSLAVKAGGTNWTRSFGSPPLDGPVSVVGGGGVLSASETPRWERAWIEQDSCARGGINQLTVVLQANAPLFPTSTVIVSGLDTATTLASTVMITGLSAGIVFDSVGTWSDPGSLSVTVNSTADPGQVLVFSFLVRNPTQVSTGVTPAVRALDSAANTLVPQLTMTSRNSVPPWVLVVGLDPTISGTIAESSQVYSAPNIVSVSLTPNTRLIPGDTVTVSGLAASQTAAGPLHLSGRDAPRFSSASFDQCLGSVILVVGQLGLPPDGTAAIAWTLINPAFPRQPAPAMASSTRTAVRELDGSVLAPTTQPSMTWRNISGASRVLGNTNAITVILRANHILQAGQRVTLSGFTPALELDAALLSISTLQPAFLPSAVNFSKPSSSVEIEMLSEVPAGTVLTFAFPLTNPTVVMYGRQPLISTSPFPPIVPVAMYHSADVLAPTRPGAWTTASISDTVRVQGAATQIWVSATADAQLPTGSQIVISKLVGAQMSAIPGIVSASGALSTQGTWNACDGELTVTVSSAVAAGSLLTFTFTTDNPFSDLSPRSRPLIRAQSSTVTIPPRLMTLSSPSFLSTLLRPTWFTATVSESVSVPNEINLITFALLPTATLAQGTTIVISGLVGTQTTDNAALSLRGADIALFTSSTGSWLQATGTLTLTVASSIPGCTDGSCSATSFAILVTNPAAAESPAATVMVSALGSTPGLELAKTVLLGSPILGAASVFSVSSIVGFSSEVAGAYSEINIILTPNLDVQAGDEVVFSGMSWFASPSATVDLSGSQATFFGSNSVAGKASWSPCGDMLVMTVMAGVSFGPSTPTPTVELQFTLLNPAVRTTTALTVTLGKRASQQLRTNVVVGHKDPTWSSTFASHDNTVMSQMNTITLGFQANTVLIPGTVVTVTGLTSSPTADSSTLTLSGGDAAAFNSRAQWTQSTGTLKMTVASASYLTARSMTTVQVSLQNSEVGVVGTNLITLAATCTRTTAGCVEIPLQQKQLASTILAPVTKPNFSLRLIAQTATAKGESSTIAVQLSANCRLPAGATVTISGLKDYLEASDATFPIADSVGIGSAAWDQLEGTMTFQVPAGGISAGQTIGLSFSLTNGLFYSAAEAPTQSVAASDSFGFVLEAQAFQTPSVAAFAHSGWFTVATIRQDTQAQAAMSSFTIDVQPSYDVPIGSILTISGLVGSRTPSTSALRLYGNGAGFYSDVGEWNALEGTLKLTMASVMSNRYPTRVSFDLINPARAQISATVLASTAVIPAQAMTVLAANGFGAVVLTGGVQPEVTASITQSTRLEGHWNTITVSLQLNAPVRTAASITISNLAATQSTRDLELPIGGLSSHRFGGSLVWDPCSSQAKLRALGGLPAATPLVFNFTVVNARAPQPRPPWCAPGIPSCIQVSILADHGQLAFVPSTFQSRVLDAGEALVLLSNNLALSTLAPGDLNELSLTIETNAAIPASSRIIVSGLYGATSPPDLIPAPGSAEVWAGNSSLGMPGLVPVRGQSAVNFTGNSTAWSPEQGTLTFTTTASIPPRTTLRVALNLRNPLPNLPRTRPHIEIVSTFFTIPRQPMAGPAYEVDTIPPTLLLLTLSSYSSDLSSVRNANLSLVFSEPSQAVCLLEKASAAVPTLEKVRSLGVHVQPSAGATTNLTDTGLSSAPRLLASTGWVEVGPVFSGIRHAVYCHYRDLAQIPNEAPAAMIETTVFEFTTPAAYLPKGSAPSRSGAPDWTLVLGSSLLLVLLSSASSRTAAGPKG